MIADRLYSQLELTRFRSICRSWRSSSSHKRFPCLSRRIAPLIRPRRTSFKSKKSASLSQATLFRIRPSSSSSQGWLIKLQKLKSGRVQLISPLSLLPIGHSCEFLDLLKFQVWGISVAYSIITREEGGIPSGFKKVVLVPDAVDYLEDARVFTIGWDGKLRYWDYQEKVWIKIDDQNSTPYDDMIIHRGQLYVIDGDGIVSWIDSFSLNVIQYAPPLGSRTGQQKNFVESCGELYVVDRCLAGRTRTGQIVEDAFVKRYGIDEDCCAEVCCSHGFCKVITRSDSKAVGFKVYKLDEEWGRWEEVKSLCDRAFVLGTDCCFSVSAHDFDGCLENSIYFTDEKDDEKQGIGLTGHDLSVFKLDDGSIVQMASSPAHFQFFSPSFLRT